MRTTLHLSLFLALFFLTRLSAQSQCSTTLSSFDATEGYEGFTPFLFDNVGGDNFNWTVNSGNTPTGFTGPSSAHGGNDYIYTETSSIIPFTNQVAILESPCLTFPANTIPYLNFWLHMEMSNTSFTVAQAMGSLTVQVNTNPTSGSTWTTLATYNTSNANWLEKYVDLSNYAGQTIKLRFRAQTGTGTGSSTDQAWAYGDRALDDILISKGVEVTHESCPGAGDGAIQLDPHYSASSSATYSYLWSTGATTSSLSSLAGGNYTVTITDNLNVSKILTLTVNSGSIPAPQNLTSSLSAFCSNDPQTATLTIDYISGDTIYDGATSVQADLGTVNSAGSPMNFTLSGTPAVATGDGTLTMFYRGDMEAAAEYVTTYSENGSSIGSTTPSSGQCSGTYNSISFTLPVDSINQWAQNGSIGLTGIPTGMSRYCSLSGSFFSWNAYYTLTYPYTSIVPYWFENSCGSNIASAIDTGFTINVTPTTTTTYYVRFYDPACNAWGACDSVTITVNSPPSVSVTPNSATYCNTAVSLTANGASTYAWAPGTGLNTTTGASVQASPASNTIYTVTGTDANSCTNTATASITVSAGPSATISSTTPVSCYGGSNGAATVSASGGSGSYTYLWSNSATTASISGLTAGNYTVTVSDGSCTSTATATVGGPLMPLTIFLFPNNIACSGFPTGSIFSSVGGGTSGYSRLWSTGSTAANIFGLTAGTYTLTVTDANGCTASADTVITAPSSALSASVTSTSNVTCFGGNNGSATVTASGGTPAYSYAWSNGQTTATATGLAAGTYFVTVTDVNGCIAFAATVITQPATGVSVSITSSVNVSCFGGNNGSATASASGGAGSITYAWSNGAAAATASGLAAGTYTVTATDGGGCTDTETITITQPAAISATFTITNIGCNGGANGAITATGTGGSGSFTSYTWSNGATGTSITGLAAGSYTVTVTDNSGCTGTATATVTQPAVLNVSITGTNATCNGSATGSATASATGGTTPYSYAWSNGSTGAAISGLAAGTYTVTTTDANGCTDTESIVITQPIALSASASANAALCNGGSSGSATASATGGTTPYSYAWNNGASTATATGLAAGTYTVTITDFNGCTTTASTTVTQPTAVIASIPSSTNATCNGGSNGSATASATGGTGSKTFTWSNGATGTSATGLAAGTYTVTATDANGCTDTETVSITQPTAVVTSITSTNTNCSGSATGTASASATGGTGSKTFAWSTGATTAAITGLAAGSYTVTATDANGCTDTETVTITQPNPVVTSITAGNVSCNGGNDGTATASATGGTSPYSYNWNTGATGANITGLAIGTYTVTATDANGCTDTETVTITQPATFTASASASNVSCNGGNNGSATATPAGGTSPYSYLWNNGNSGATTSNLVAGTYTVTVTDANGCTATASTTLTQPATAVTVSATSTNVMCNGGSNGTATAAGAGGTGSISYTWSSGAATATATGLAAGTYTVTATDANGCTATTSVTITQPSAITIPSLTVVNTSCNGGSNGSLTANPSGGTPGYTYSWSNGGTTQTITGLAPGTYTVTVTDAGACTATMSGTVTQPASITLTTSVTSISCSGGANGSITATATGGTGTKTYAWNTGATGATISGLSTGTYTVTATDANGCTATASASVTQPSSVVASVSAFTNPGCNGGTNGTATASASGGTTPYSFTWSNGNATAAATGLAAGTYTVTITDANGCTDTETVAISEPTAVIAAIASTDVSCNGGSNGSATASATGGTGSKTFTWSNGATNATVTGLVAGTYTVTATDANGCTDTETITILQPSAVTASISSTDVSCNGGTDGSATASATGGTGTKTFNWSNGATTATITGLAAGSYTVTATDANGCTGTATVTITQPVPIGVTVTTTNVSCNGGANGSATASTSGGASPYVYAWSNGATGSTVSGLAAGIYTTTVTDANGCTDSETFTITQPVALTASITGSVDVSCNGGATGSATASATGGIPTYSYSWSNGSSGITATGLNAGTHTVTVTDANGCTATASVVILQPTALSLSVGINSQVSCNGGANGSATATATGGISPYSYTWSNGGTGSTVSGLAAGTYTATVTDANLCTSTQSFTITQPAALAASIAVVIDAACYGEASGGIASQVTGGTASYSYLWSTGSISANLISVPSGTYTLTVTDALGCTDTAEVFVDQPDSLSLSATVTGISCNGAADGIIAVTASGGTPAYSYYWSTGSFSNSDSNLSAGTYTITVGDLNDCFKSFSINLSDPAILTGSIVLEQDAGCGGDSTAMAVVAGSGGTQPYTYQWSAGAVTNDDTLQNIPAGTYVVTLTDANGCNITDTATLSEPAPLVLTLDSAADVTCAGGSNGYAAVSTVGGAGGYTYLWTDGGSASVRNNLIAGIHCVTVTDANGCTNSLCVTITELNALPLVDLGPDTVVCETPYALDAGAYVAFQWSNGQTSQNINVTANGSYSVTVTDINGCQNSDAVSIGFYPQLTFNVSTNAANCGMNDGQAAIANLSGGGGYNINWSTGQTGGLVANNLSFGAYNVTVTDQNGCSLSEAFLIGNNSSLSASVNTQDVLCNGGASGQATVSASAGVPPYGFTWSNGSAGSVATGLNAGIYYVTVTDSVGCQVFDTAVISEPAAIVVAVASTASACGDSTGSASVTGITPPGSYTYLWNDPLSQTTATATNLPAGAYDVTVTDANGCTGTALSLVNDNNAPSIAMSAVNESCQGSGQGSASAIAGGSGPFNYLWNDPLNQTSATASNLVAGLYFVTVTDVNGCTGIDSVSVGYNNASPAVSLGSDTSVCANFYVLSPGSGFTAYQWNTGSSNTAISVSAGGTYTVTVTDANGCTGSADIDLVLFPPIAVMSNVTNSYCSVPSGSVGVTVLGGGGTYSFLWSTGDTTAMIYGLGAGNYDLSITDNNGCTMTDSYAVGYIGGPSLTVTSSDATCFGSATGSASATAGAGNPPYSYSWSNGETGSVITALVAGSYDITLTDDSGCVVIEPFVIGEAPEMTVSISSTAPNCGMNNGSAQASVGNNQGPLLYLWDDPANTMSAGVSGLFAGFYTVEVTDSAGCMASGSVALSDSGAATLITGATDNTCSDDAQGSAFVQALGSAPFTYLWNDALAQTNDTATQLMSGIYAVSVSDANGCIAIGTATVGYFNSVPVIDLGADITACVGDEVILTPGGGFATYFWTTGATTPSVVATMSQPYDVSVTDFNGCSATDTVDVNFIAPPVVDLGPDTVVCTDHSQPSVLLDAGAGFNTYLWSTNATSQTISVNSTGIYKVTVSNAACNGSDQVIVVFDSCINVSAEEIAGKATPVLLLYPNPSRGQFTIETSGLTGGRYTLRIMNASGQVVMSQPMTLQEGIGSRDEFDLRAMPAGVYVITLEGENLRMDQRVILQ